MKTLAELAKCVGGELVGPPELQVSAVADIASAGSGALTFLVKEGEAGQLDETRAAAAVVPLGMSHERLPLIRVANPTLAIARIHTLLLEKPFVAAGIHESAVVASSCSIGRAVSIGANAVLGDEVVVGEWVQIGAGVVVGDGAVIDDETVLHANVSVGARCRIGKRCIVHSGTVIGSDGFGYATDERGCHLKRPHVGIVQIDDDVELGANVCVDRATFGCTHIKSGTKIDNLVQVGHNVEIGENTLMVSQSGISGSSRLGRNVVVGGQVGISDHLSIGDYAMIGSKSGVHSNMPEKAVFSGYPAFAHRLWLRACSVVPKLPELVKDVRLLKKQVAGLLESGTGNEEK